MSKKLIAITLSVVLLSLSGCGSSSSTKFFQRENTSLAYIQTVAVLPFEGGGNAPRIREFTMTQVLASGLFDVVDKGRVDNLLQEEALAAGTPLDEVTLRRLGQRLNVQAFILGAVQQVTTSRGSAAFPEITMTLRLVDRIQHGLSLPREAEAAAAQPRGNLRIGNALLLRHVRLLDALRDSGLEAELQGVIAQEVIEMMGPVFDL